MVNFRIVNGKELPYEDIKNDYVNGLKGKPLRDKYGITTTKYSKLLKRMEEDGVKTRRKKDKTYRTPTYIHYSRTQNIFKVERFIEGKRVYGGSFKRRIDAELRVKELNENGWVV